MLNVDTRLWIVGFCGLLVVVVVVVVSGVSSATMVGGGGGDGINRSAIILV